MKILMLNTALNMGGAARMAGTLVSGLQSLGDDLEVYLYHCQNRIIAPPFYGIKKPFSRQFNALVARFLGSPYTIDFGVSKEISMELGEVDVLHLHNLHGYYLNYRNLLKNVSKKPIVWTWHDMWGATGRCGFSQGCEEWRSGCKQCPNKSYYPAAWFDMASYEFEVKSKIYSNLNNLHIVAPSEWMADIAIERGFPSNRLSIIPNPVDLENFRPHDSEMLRREFGMDVNKFYALFVAADCNDPRKGYEDYLEVIESTGINGIAIGVPPVLKSKNIHCVGTLASSEELAKWYAACDLMVITSRADNYPNTVIESLACGTPVCGYSVGGIPTQMPDGWPYLVEPGDVKSLIDVVKRFIKEKRFGIQDRSRLSIYARMKWSPESVARQYLNIYQAIQV